MRRVRPCTCTAANTDRRHSMSEAELYKFFSSYDGEADLSDFTPEELSRLLAEQGDAEKNFKQKYFEYYDDVKSKSLKKQDW